MVIMNKAHGRHNECGSVFFYILLGVILFGTLSYVVAKGMRGQATTAMSERQAELTASNIISYSQKVSRGVNRVRLNGCSESEISFHHGLWGHTQYEHTPSVDNKCKIFHPDGGNVTFVELAKQHDEIIESMARFIIVGRSEIDGIGTTCGADSCTDLYIFLRLIHADNVCRQLNEILGISPTLPIDGGIYGDTRFTGSFSYGNTLTNAAFTKQIAGCYQDNSETYTDGTPYYDFYYVLLER